MAFIYGTAGGSGTFTGGTISNSTTMAAAKSFIVTTADLLTVGGVIVPQTKTETFFYEPGILGSSNQNLFIADEAYQITRIALVLDVIDATNTVLTVEKLTGTQAPTGGITMFTAAQTLNIVANTVTVPALTATTSSLQLAAGNRIGLYTDQSATGPTLIVVTITFKRI